MQTRFILHVGYQRNTPVAYMVEVGGQYIGFTGSFTRPGEPIVGQHRPVKQWLKRGFLLTRSLAEWKAHARSSYGANRFERVTILGDTRHYNMTF